MEPQTPDSASRLDKYAMTQQSWPARMRRRFGIPRSTGTGTRSGTPACTEEDAGENPGISNPFDHAVPYLTLLGLVYW